MEAKRYQLLYCRVPKAGSTNMDRVYGQLIKESDYPKIRNKMVRSYNELLTNNYSENITVHLLILYTLRGLKQTGKLCKFANPTRTINI